MELISREQVIATIDSFNVFESRSDQIKLELMIGELPIAGVSTNLAEVGTDVPGINVGDINKFIDSLEEIFADIRERHVDDSVCGLCEYDGAYIGQSGDWCNECPGFDRDDCFKLSDKCRKRWIDTITKALPSVTPKRGKWIRDGHHIRCDQCGIYMCDTDREGDRIPIEFCPNCGAKMEE